MVDAERDHIEGQFHSLSLRDRLKSLYEGLSKWEALVFPRIDFRHPTLGVSTSDLTGRMIIFLWNLKDLKQPRLRLLIAILFAIGLTLLTVPAVFTFMQVTFVALRHFMP